MSLKSTCVLVGFMQSTCALCLVAGTEASSTTVAFDETYFIPAVQVEQPLYFIGADGSDVTVSPNLYRVERRADTHLALISETDQQEILVEAMKGTHELEAVEPVAGPVSEGDDLFHLLFILSGGERLEAVGTRSEIRSRAPSAPLSSAQVSQAMSLATASSLLAKESAVLGAPPPPALISPALQERLALSSIEFRWSPGIGQPAATSFQLCIAEAGTSCPRPGETSSTSVVVPHIPASEPRLKVDIRHAERLLLPFRGERALIWTVAACAASQVSSTIGHTNPLICRYASPAPLFWTPRLYPPILTGPVAGAVVNDRPQLSSFEAWGARHYLFRISPSTVSSDGQGSVVVNTGLNTSMTGWEWGALPINSPTGLSPEIFAGKRAWWSTAACLDDAHCTWASNSAWVRILPAPTLQAPVTYLYSSSPQHEFVWTAPSDTQEWITHYRLCFATQGSALVPGRRTLVDIPGMLRDLCSDDIPAGDQPAYRKPVPASFASLCPSSGCRMPEPVATIYTTQPRWIINLQEHPDWSRFANQSVVWTAAACNGSNRNCMWQTKQYGAIRFPPASREPGLGPIRIGQAVTVNWEPAAGNVYYIPCLREPNASCNSGNLLGSPRFQSQSENPGDHPSKCTLTGPYPTGPKIVQVAGCNDVWGCRWSESQTINLGANQAGHRTEPRLSCR